MQNTFPDSESFGIFQGSLIVKTAIELAIEDIRAKPWLLDYCFNFLIIDTETNKTNGALEVKRAKEFFLKNKIPVFMHTHKNAAEMPCVSIKLLSSAESSGTLGDVNYDNQEAADIQWPALVSTFDPISYDPVTGYLTVPAIVSQQLWLSAGQLVVDKLNNVYPIIKVNSATVIRIQKGLTVDLTGLVIKGQKPSYIATMESAEFTEIYSIGVHAENEPIYMVYLHSIITFILLAYRQSLLEGRNFQISKIQSSDEQINELFGKELVYSRYIQLTGTAHNQWPKLIVPRITGVASQIRIADSGHMFPAGSDSMWVGSEDELYDVPGEKFKDEGPDPEDE